MEKLDILKDRLAKLGIDIKYGLNYPWVYIDYINGVRISKEDYFYGNHGFTVMFAPIREGQIAKFTCISEIFKLIRKYTNKQK